MYDSSLQHYGVKGMKWGKHRVGTSPDTLAMQSLSDTKAYQTGAWLRARGYDTSISGAVKAVASALKNHKKTELKDVMNKLSGKGTEKVRKLDTKITKRGADAISKIISAKSTKKHSKKSK